MKKPASPVVKCTVEELEAMQKAGTDDEVERRGYIRVGNLLVMDREARRVEG
jgi:hypothetical protein